MAESLQDTLQNTRSELLDIRQDTPEFTTRNESVDALTVYKQRRKREAETTISQYIGAMWRQDSPVDGIMADIVGSQLAPDPNYMPYEEEEWKRLTEGIPPEFHHHFHQATSAVHGQYIRQRLLDKLADLTKLGDLGLTGNVGRIALNFLEPTSLLAGIASGGVFKFASGMRLAGQMARRATTATEAAEAAGAVARAARAESSTGAITAGLATGGGIEAAVERLRQNVNFEDDSAAVLEAGLLGMIFSAPFIYAGSRSMRRLAETAELERETLNVLGKVNRGEPLTEADLKTIGAHSEMTKRLGLQAEGAEQTTYTEAAQRWLQRFKDDLDGTPDPERPSPADPAGPRAGAGAAPGAAPEGATFAPHKVNEQRMREEAQRLFDQEMAKRETQAKSEVEGMKERGEITSDEALRLLTDATKAVRTRKATVIKKKSRKASAERERARAKKELEDLLNDIRREVEGEPAGEPTGAPRDADGGEPQADRIEGTEVFWRDGSGLDAGVVVGRMPNGKYKIDLDTTLPPNVKKLRGGGARYVYKYPSELDMDSPLWEDVTPEGFGPNTAGAAQVSGTRLEEYDDPVSPDFDSPTSGLFGWGKARLDLFARLNSSSNPVVQRLAHLLVKDAVGNSREFAQRWTASERKKMWQRVLGGRFHAQAKAAFEEVRKIRGISMWNAEDAAKQFYSDVSRVVRGDQDVLKANQDIAPQLQRAAKEMRDVYAAMAEIAKKSGLEGAENLVPNEAYVNRIWNHDNIRQMEMIHGADAVIEVLANAISGDTVARFKQSPRYKQMLAQGKGSDRDIREAKAKSFLAAVKRLEFSPTLQDVHLVGRDMGTLRDTLKKEGLTDQQIDDIVDVMFEVRPGEGDAGMPTNLRFRFDLDETTSVKTSAGTLRMMDLLENDSRLLVDMYLNAMAGHAALAERGITSRAAFQKELEAARRWYAENEQSVKGAEQINEEIKHLEDIYSYLTGRPMSMQQFNKVDRIAGALRAYARASFLGQLGVAAAFEMTNAMALTGLRAFFDASGGFRGFLQAVRTGKVPNAQVMESIERWTGFGHEAAMAYARQNEITDYTYDRGLSRFENWGNRASHVVDYISGNRHFTAATRQMSAAGFIQKHIRMAGKKLSKAERERLVHQGLDNTQIDEVLANLKKYAKLDDKGRVLELNWEDWQKADPRGFDSYMLVLNRSVRDAIQDHDIGEIPMFMHTTIGKIFGELRTFMVASHAKQFLKNLHYMDRTTATLFMFSLVSQSMAYAAQTAMNFAHNPEELERRLSFERIAGAAVQRMSVLGITPALFETAWYIGSGGDSFFQGGTTNTDNRNLLMTPSGMMITRGLKALSVGVGAINPFTDNITTRGDVKDSFAILPGGNTFLMRNVIDMLSSQFPKYEAREAP